MIKWFLDGCFHNQSIDLQVCVFLVLFSEGELMRTILMAVVETTELCKGLAFVQNVLKNNNQH
jgi:hypothetical protein